MSKIGALEALLAASKPVALKTRALVGDLAQGLKGARASGAQWYAQLKNMPGVKPEKLEEAFGHLKDNPMQLTKDEFLQSVVNPKLSTQVGFSRGGADNINELADDLLWQNPRTATMNKRYMDEWLADNAGHIPNEERYRLLQAFLADGGHHRNIPEAYQDAFSDAQYYASEQLQNSPEMMEALGRARGMAKPIKGPAERQVYKGFQRQGLANETDPYFETVLRQDPKKGENLAALRDDSYHFSNPGQIAHARGSIHNRGTGRNMLVEEIQSDPIEALAQRGLGKELGYSSIKTPHGDMAKALLLQAAKGGADNLIIPDAKQIASVRAQKYLPAMQNIYDDQLSKEFYRPLDKMGIPTKESHGYRTININPDLREMLSKYGLGFKAGGKVEDSYKPKIVTKKK